MSLEPWAAYMESHLGTGVMDVVYFIHLDDHNYNVFFVAYSSCFLFIFIVQLLPVKPQDICLESVGVYSPKQVGLKGKVVMI